MYTELEKSILQTLVYFDFESFPLTKEEVFYYLWKSPSTNLTQVESALNNLLTQRLIEECWGYFFLAGRKKIVEERRERLVSSELLLAKARFAVKLVNWVPFLKSIFICNSIASETATHTSDIDFFTIASPGRIWTVRFITNIVLFCAGIRRHGNKIAKRICLSFYISLDSLDLASQRIEDDDIHFIYWLEQMIPLYDPKDIYSTFKQSNSWVNKFLPNSLPLLNEQNYVDNVEQKKIKKLAQSFLEFCLSGHIGNFLEKFLRKIQLLKMKSSAKQIVPEADRGVYISDQIIKLHEKDRRRSYLNAWLEKIKKYDF
jgi:hypothetical protein